MCHSIGLLSYHNALGAQPLSLFAGEVVQQRWAKFAQWSKAPTLVVDERTPVDAAIEVLSELDLVLVMSVNPGFGGQSFIPAVEKKIRILKKAIDQQVADGGRPVQIQIDGGVKAHNIAMLQSWGVSNCVVGSGLFNDRATLSENLSVIHTALQG